MKKKYLIRDINIFMDQAFQANCYYSIIEQIDRSRSEYNEELSISSAFYSYTYNALVIAVFMEISKIYDRNRQSIDIKRLFTNCKENISFFPKEQEIKEKGIDGKMYIIAKFPFRHTVKNEEIEFFQEDINKQQPFSNLSDFEQNPFSIEMTIDRYFELYEWRLRKIELQIDNVLKQRNKIYAHNDKATLKADLDQTMSKFPVSHKDIKSLIAFALDFCQFAYAMLTGISKSKAPDNIKDLEHTLSLVRLGEKYQDFEVEKQMENDIDDSNLKNQE